MSTDGKKGQSQQQPEAYARPNLIQSPNALPQPGPSDPAMSIERLKAYRKTQNTSTTKQAIELLERTGPLVLDGLQYRLNSQGKVETVPVEFLGMSRQQLAQGLDKLKVSSDPRAED